MILTRVSRSGLCIRRNDSLEICMECKGIVIEQIPSFSDESNDKRVRCGAYVRSLLRVARSLTSCLVRGPTLCQTGSSCRRTMASKDRKYAFSTLRSSTSSWKQLSIQGKTRTSQTIVFDRLSSANVVDIHCTSPPCISFIDSVMGWYSSTTSARLRSNDSFTASWKLQPMSNPQTVVITKRTEDRSELCVVVILS
jgi:hypothetical protein